MPNGSTMSITRAARTEFSVEQVRLMRDTVARDCSDAEFHFFLEVCARYEFNPFLGEIYAAKMPSRNGGGGRVAIIVGRNGWIKEANRRPNFQALDGDVVREKDVYKVVRTPDGNRAIYHEYNGHTAARGKVVGAWAEVRLTDRPSVYFYAPVEEYKPTGPKLDYSPWSKQESVMMLKCAQVAALRLAFNIGGVYDEAEMAHAMQHDSGAPVQAVDIEWGEGPLATRLMALAERANEVAPGSYMPAKLALKLNGASDAEREAFAGEIERFLAEREASIVDAEVIG